jgi:hypothetical protein
MLIKLSCTKRHILTPKARICPAIVSELKARFEYLFRRCGPAQRRRGPPGLTVTLIRSEMTGGS